MRRSMFWTLLPLVLLAACQSTGQSSAPSKPSAKQCPPRLQDAGQCNLNSIYSFPELANVN